MAGIKNYSTTAADNATVGSVNFAEGQVPSTVNDSARQLMADIRSDYENREWRDWGHTVTYATATTFTIATDVTSVYTTDRPIKCTDSATLYGIVASSSYSAPNTTVTVTLDSGSLSASLTAVALGPDPSTQSISVQIIRNGNSALLAATNSFTGANTYSGTLTMSGAAINEAAEVSIASAATVNIGAAASNNVYITGTTTITAFDTVAAGITRKVRFAGALTLTHNGTSLILPGSANITTAANDCAEFESLGSGNWICTKYSPASGQQVIAASASQGSSLVLIASQTASSSATLDFANNFATYRNYLFVLENIVPATNAVGIYMRVSTDGGSTYYSGASDYTYVTYGTDAGAAAQGVGSTAAAQINITGLNGPSNTAAYGGLSGEIRLYNANGTSVRKHFKLETECIDTAGTPNISILVGSGFCYNATAISSAINGVRFLASSGNITSGTIYLYGIKTA